MKSMKDYVDEVMDGINQNDVEDQEHQADYNDYFDQLICPFCRHPELNMIVKKDPHNAEGRIIWNQCQKCECTWVAANIEGEGMGMEIDLRPLFPKKPD